MDKTQTTETVAQGAPVQDLNYWIQEYEYFMDSIEGLRMAHSILKAMSIRARQKITEFDENYKFEE